MERILNNLGMSNLEKLKGFHNDIYKATYQEKDIIIRISERRTKEELLEEVMILNEVKDQVRIAAPVKVDNQYVIKEKAYILCFFELVNGLNWYETTLTQNTHFEAGKELGLLHLALSKLPNVSRNHFDEHPDIQLLKDAKELYQDELSNLLNKLNSYKVDKREYGLIHGDYLFSNLLYHEDGVTIIDFDDMEYNYYLYDIAVYLFYLLLGGNPSDIDKKANIEIFQSFIKGYIRVNQEVILDFDKLMDLFRLRQLKLLGTITKKFDQSSLGEWQKKYIKLCEEQFMNDQDFVDIPYKKIYQDILERQEK